MKISSSRFDTAAYSPEGEPALERPCAVFLGRSNVGKSSLINRLLGVKGLARTSSQPGRTQSVNYYMINESWYMIDLPGYGYAKVPLEVRRSWGPMVQGFLERHNKSIGMAVLLVDARRDPTEMDRQMRDWVESHAVNYLIVATKSDKLSGNGRANAQRVLTKEFGGEKRVDPMMVSATTGTGMQLIWRHLDRVQAGDRTS
jgi:GTP-binding protein